MSDAAPTPREAAAARRRQQTEQKLVDAATALFLERGYAATSMADIANASGVSERTLYVRFATKVALFQRVIEVGIVGDVEATSMPERPWSVTALTAPTATARIEAFADGVTAMHARLGPLMAVNAEVESAEQAVRESAAGWRAATLAYLERFWEAMRDDGLVSPGADLRWLIDTSTVLTAAESRLLISRSLGWGDEAYRAWVVTTLTRIAGTSVAS